MVSVMEKGKILRSADWCRLSQLVQILIHNSWQCLNRFSNMKVLVSSRAFLLRESTLISKATSSSIDHMSDHNQEGLVAGGWWWRARWQISRQIQTKIVEMVEMAARITSVISSSLLTNAGVIIRRGLPKYLPGAAIRWTPAPDTRVMHRCGQDRDLSTYQGISSSQVFSS